jgi:hypothetical protein
MIARVSYAVVFSFVVLGSYLCAFCGESESAKDLLAQAKDISAKRKTVCQKLLKMFQDKKSERADRLEAARLLAEMRYEPALASMLKNIDLQTAKELIGEADIRKLHPILAFLEEFGYASVPTIVSGYLSCDTKNEEKRASLMKATLAGKVLRDHALVYIDGLLQCKDKESKKKKLSGLKEWITKAKR